MRAALPQCFTSKRPSESRTAAQERQGALRKPEPSSSSHRDAILLGPRTEKNSSAIRSSAVARSPSVDSHRSRSRGPNGSPALVLVLLAISPGPLQAGEDSPVVTAGTAQLTIADVERRLSGLPAFQLQSLAPTLDQAKRQFVEKAVVPELLLGQEAIALRLEQEPQVQERMRVVLAQALVADEQRRLERESPVTEQEVRSYFDAYQEHWRAPRRLRIFRILLDDEGRARDLIQQTRGTLGLAHWTNRARELSVDLATRMRGGDLGFVRPDGSTDVPALRVNPALFEAADRVSDGQLVPNPIREGDRYAVVWRRGSLPEQPSSLAREAPAIRRQLARERLDTQMQTLLAALRRKHVTLPAPHLVEQVALSQSLDGFVTAPVMSVVASPTGPAPL